MNTWIISDTHFNHTNIIHFCGRPFTTVDEMNKVMIDNWNSVVDFDDIVYHLGDFSMVDKSLETTKSFVSSLNGQIYLVTGNHDTKSQEFYLEAGFKKVYDKPIIVSGAILSHEPIFLGEHSIFVNFYGHTHQYNYGNELQYFNCCVEQNNYTPVSFFKQIGNFKRLNNAD